MRGIIKAKRKLGGELVIPIVAVIFTTYYFSTLWNSPWTAQVSAFLVGGVLLAVCALFIKVVLMLRSGEGTLSFANLVNIEDVRTGRVFLIAFTVGYCLVIEPLGFTLATFLFLLLSMLALARFNNALTIFIVSTVMALGSLAVFIWAFDTRFPRGWFEGLMEGLIRV